MSVSEETPPPDEAARRKPQSSVVLRPPDEATVEGIIEDIEDLEQAQCEPSYTDTQLPMWRRLGPGLITGAADDDPSGIGTYSVAGAQFGYGMLWMALFSLPLMIAVQEMCGRLAAITGQGLTTVIKQHYPRWLMWGCVGLLLGANTINIWADLNVMAASLKMLFGLPFVFWLTLTTLVIVAAQIAIPYKYYVRVLKWLCLALGAYVVTALLPGVHNDWPQIVRHLFVPSWSKDPAFLMTVVGFLGTTISPYLFFWQAGETVEEEVAEGESLEPGSRLTRVKDEEIRMVRADTVVGMLASQTICFFIMICTAATLHTRGITDINTAQDAAKALLPLGPAAFWIFTLGIVGTGLLAIPTLAGSAAYAIAEASGWRYGLYRRFQRARAFYATIAIVIVAGYGLNFVHAISPVKALLYSAVLNGLAAPPLIVVLLLICNNARIVKHRRNGLWSNILGWAAAVLMTLAAGLLIWGLATGKV